MSPSPGRRRALAIGAVAGIALALPLLPVHHAAAATTISVNVTDDNVGDTCPATCSLRAAINVANLTTGDTVSVPAGTYTLAQGQLVISAIMTVTGAGAATTIVDGASLSRVFRIDASGNATMSGLTIRNGRVVSAVGGDAGAGIEVFGALQLSNSTVLENTVAITTPAPPLTASPSGAGIAGELKSTSLTLVNVVVNGNRGSSTNFAFIGGGVGSRGALTFSGGVVDFNVASLIPSDGLGEGGGISVTSGTATLDSLNVHDNVAGGGGGVVDESGPSTMTNSTLWNNHSKSTNDDGGGWLANGNPDSLTNVTIVGNDSVNGGGGFVDFSGASSTLLNDTITSNTAAFAGGGVLAGTRSATSVTGTIIAGNTPDNCGLVKGGAVTSLGSNIDSGTTCGFAAAGDKASTDPALAALGNNGGPAPTRAITKTSPAFDADINACPPPATDERGVTRPQGARCDIGAFELAVSVTPVVPPAGADTTPLAGAVAVTGIVIVGAVVLSRPPGRPRRRVWPSHRR